MAKKNFLIFEITKILITQIGAAILKQPLK